MTPQQIADQKAFHRAELKRLDALEKAQRPALAAGQVWRSPEWGVSIICAWDGTSGSVYNIERQSLVHYANGLADCFVFVGLARDVLRVVPPDAGGAMEHVAPVQDEPTGDGLDYPGLLKLATEKACRIVALMYPAGDPRIKDRVESITIGIFTEYCISPLYREGLARDVLRVVQPDAVEQVAPVQDEPTGAELVGKTCLVNDGGETWYGPYPITHWAQYPYTANGALWRNAKLYREGVTP